MPHETPEALSVEVEKEGLTPRYGATQAGAIKLLINNNNDNIVNERRSYNQSESCDNDYMQWMIITNDILICD